MTNLDEISLNDESWDKARQLVHKHLSGAPITWRLIKNSWAGGIDEKEFVRLFCFTRVPARCLIRAANIPAQDTTTIEDITQAVKTLGVPLACVVVGIHTACASILNQRPPLIWKRAFQEIMTLVEIGYHFGNRVHGLGTAAGCLAGFAVGAGMLIAIKEDVNYLIDWLNNSITKSSHSRIGAEMPQLSAFVIQHLGYGHEAAFGAAFGHPNFLKQTNDLPPQIVMWVAALRWIESLRDSRNYPADINLRSLFPSLTPPAPGSGQRNATLEVLYSEVAPAARDGSKWTWHLPKDSYEKTEALLSLT